MKKIYLIPALMLLLFSCSDNTEFEQRELDITIGTIADNSIVNEILIPSEIIPISGPPVFYPNPFISMVSVKMNTQPGAEITFFNNQNNTKTFNLDNNPQSFDFANEASGVYRCEIKTGDKVYVTYLIKM